jgi:putative ABC transport system permease protein
VVCANYASVMGALAYPRDAMRQGIDRGDATVQFIRGLPPRVRHEIAALPGVAQSEVFRAVAVRLHAGHHERQIAIIGLERGGTLRRLVDLHGDVFDIPPAGLTLSATLGRVLGVRVGDTLVVDVLERGGTSRRVVVAALLDEIIGTSAYMELGELHRLIGAEPTLSGAFLAFEPGAEVATLDRIARLPGVSSAVTRRAMLQNFEDSMASNIRLTTTIVTFLASSIAVGVLYNGARVALSERGHELASLRVLGFTRAEVTRLLFGEQGIIDAIGTPLGLLIGVGFAYSIAIAFQSELYRFPVIVTARTYVFAIGVVAAASVFAGLALRRRLGALDLVAVLKTRE